MNKRILLFLILMVCFCTPQEFDNQEDLESYLTDAKYLYQDEENNVDPNDMFVDFDALRKARSDQDKIVKQESQVPSSSIKTLCSDHLKDLATCKDKMDAMHEDYEKLSKSFIQLNKNKPQGGKVDYRPFYKRLLKLVWNTLLLEDSQKFSDMQRELYVYLKKEDVNKLKLCMQTNPELSIDQCDDALTTIFTSFQVIPDKEGIISSLIQRLPNVPSIHSPEMWLYVLGSVIFCLVFYAVALSVKQLVKSSNWYLFFLLICCLVFAFCCLWTWRNMIKEEEARRAVAMEKRVNSGGISQGTLPPECSSQSLWDSWFGNSDERCKRYFDDLYLSASEEVRPDEAIVRTVQTFIFAPLGSIGKGMGMLFKEFYSEVPILYLVPATVMLFVLLLVVLLLLCGYSIHLPLFMGSISPHTSAPQQKCVQGNVDADAIIQQLRLEQREINAESRKMMLDIREATLANTSHSPQVLQPILTSSYQSIENQLDRLISDRLRTVLETSHHSKYIETPDRNIVVPCITHQAASTPSRREKYGTTKDQLNDSCDESLRTHAQGSIMSPIVGSQHHWVKSSGHDNIDGNKSVEERAPPHDDSVESQDKSAFYGRVSGILSDSLNSSVNKVENLNMENTVNDLKHKSSDLRRRSSRVRNNKSLNEESLEVPLSPGSKTFLKKVAETLES